MIKIMIVCKICSIEKNNEDFYPRYITCIECVLKREGDIFTCNDCGIDKERKAFYNRYKTCKDCIKKRQRDRNKRDKLKERSGLKVCNTCSEEKDIQEFRVNRASCLDCEREYGRDYNQRTETRKIWSDNNKQRHRALTARWIKEKYKNDPMFKFQQIQRKRLSDVVKKFKQGYNTDDFIEYLGKLEILKQWLEFCMTEEMTWDNHGSYWHLDHVIPLFHFDLTINDQIYLCFNWKNVMPLTKEENLQKNRNIIQEQVLEHMTNLQTFCQNKNIDYQNHINLFLQHTS